ncbi:MAG: hypothetical protein ABSA18_16255 [Dehalococcoidia bacterium]
MVGWSAWLTSIIAKRSQGSRGETAGNLLRVCEDALVGKII